ncbi:hypothetical protein O71_05912 [Pontibacter sp. BAB1700]|nr:hypothetical protein O71_05912 [Pontibacter sp. BAB1700]
MPNVVLPQRQVVQQVAGTFTERRMHAFDGAGKFLFQFKGVVVQLVELCDHLLKVFLVCLHHGRGIAYYQTEERRVGFFKSC